MSYELKNELAQEELFLINRYPEELHENLKKMLLDSKNYSKGFYEDKIEAMEQGRKISFSGNVTSIGEPNGPKLARLLLEMHEGRNYKPLKEELEWDDRLEGFKQYPKGTRVKANGEIVY